MSKKKNKATVKETLLFVRGQWKKKVKEGRKRKYR
jgi:hypothetical protein